MPIYLVSQASGAPDLDFDIDMPQWNDVDASSTCTGTATHDDICVIFAFKRETRQIGTDSKSSPMWILFDISMM